MTAAPAAGVVVVDSPSDHVPIWVLVGPKGDRYSQSKGIDDVSPNHNRTIGGPQRPVVVHATVAGIAIVNAAAPTASASAANAAPSLVHGHPLYGVPIICTVYPQLVACHGLNVLVQPQLARAGRYLHPLQAAADGIEAVQTTTRQRGGARLSLGCSRCRSAGADAAVERRAERRVGRGGGVVRIHGRGRFGPVVQVSPIILSSSVSAADAGAATLPFRDERPARSPLLPQPLQPLLEQLLLLIGRQARRQR